MIMSLITMNLFSLINNKSRNSKNIKLYFYILIIMLKVLSTSHSNNIILKDINILINIIKIFSSKYFI